MDCVTPAAVTSTSSPVHCRQYHMIENPVTEQQNTQAVRCISAQTSCAQRVAPTMLVLLMG